MAAADDPQELVDTYEVVTIGATETDIGGRHVVTSVKMTVRVNGEPEVRPLWIGPRVEVTKISSDPQRTV